MRVIALATVFQYAVLHLHFSKVGSSAASARGFASCYVANYSCTLTHEERGRMFRNILTCTSTQLHACFPYFGHPSVRLVDPAANRIAGLGPHAYDYRHANTLNVYADLTQIPASALNYLPALEALAIDRPPTLTGDRSLITIDIHHNAFADAGALRDLTFRHTDFTQVPKRRRRTPWSRKLGLALAKAKFLERLTFDRCRFDHLDREFFGDESVRELRLTSCHFVYGGGFSNDALEGYGRSLEQLIIKDTALPAFPYTVRRLTSLTKLVLSGCDLRSLPDDAFAEDAFSSSPTSALDLVGVSSRILQELDLSFNRLENIGRKAFRPLIDLAQLSLEGNPTLASLPANVFSENRRLKSMDLRECFRLHSLAMEQLRGLENTLTRLSLRNCRGLRVLRVSNLTRLRELNAQSCGIEKLTKEMFGRQQRFTDGELNLNENPLRSIEEGTFDGVDLPRLWQLKGTHLTTLDLSSAFVGAGSLTSLELKRNIVLGNLTVSDVRNVPSTLREIKLGSNGDFRLADSGRKLKRFLLERKAKLIMGEAWLCSCDWHWLQEMRHFIDFQDGGDAYRWWSLRESASSLDNEDGAYCCNAIARKGTNDTLPLYAETFLATFSEYCGKGETPKRDRLLSSCNAVSSFLVRGESWPDLVTKLMALAVLVLWKLKM